MKIGKQRHLFATFVHSILFQCRVTSRSTSRLWCASSSELRHAARGEASSASALLSVSEFDVRRIAAVARDLDLSFCRRRLVTRLLQNSRAQFDRDKRTAGKRTGAIRAFGTAPPLSVRRAALEPRWLCRSGSALSWNCAYQDLEAQLPPARRISVHLGAADDGCYESYCAARQAAAAPLISEDS